MPANIKNYQPAYVEEDKVVIAKIFHPPEVGN